MTRERSVRVRLARGLAVAAALAGAATAVELSAAAPASAAPSRVVSATSATDSTARKSATAFCPAGTRLYGGGGTINGGAGRVALTGLRPVPGVKGVVGRTDSFVATAEAVPGATLTWSVSAFAICGPGLANLTIVQGQPTSTSGPRLEVGLDCPAGTAPTGLGAEIGNGAGQVALNSLLGNYSTGPYGTQYGWSAAKAIVADTGHPGTWTLTPYAVCATPPAGLTYRFVDSAYDGSTTKAASAVCPAGTAAYGVGGYIDYLTGDIRFTSMAPSATADRAAVLASADNGFPYPWWATAEAICAS